MSAIIALIVIAAEIALIALLLRMLVREMRRHRTPLRAALEREMLDNLERNLTAALQPITIDDLIARERATSQIIKE